MLSSRPLPLWQRSVVCPANLWLLGHFVFRDMQAKGRCRVLIPQQSLAIRTKIPAFAAASVLEPLALTISNIASSQHVPYPSGRPFQNFHTTWQHSFLCLHLPLAGGFASVSSRWHKSSAAHLRTLQVIVLAVLLWGASLDHALAVATGCQNGSGVYVDCYNTTATVCWSSSTDPDIAFSDCQAAGFNAWPGWCQSNITNYWCEGTGSGTPPTQVPELEDYAAAAFLVLALTIGWQVRQRNRPFA